MSPSKRLYHGSSALPVVGEEWLLTPPINTNDTNEKNSHDVEPNVGLEYYPSLQPRAINAAENEIDQLHK